jgi:hypothetical protein
MAQIKFSEHARFQIAERGTTESEVKLAIESGSREPARRGRRMYWKNFKFGRTWRGKRYDVKQVAPVVSEEGDTLVVVVTVYVFYF